MALWHFLHFGTLLLMQALRQQAVKKHSHIPKRIRHGTPRASQNFRLMRQRLIPEVFQNVFKRLRLALLLPGHEQMKEIVLKGLPVGAVR